MALELETLPRDVMRSLGFLTRLPIPAKWFEGDDGKLGMTVRAFPMAGALSALPAAIILVAGTLFDLPVLLTAILTVATLTATGGGLHEDGLADVADGFFGGKDKARRLEIMKDSRIGAFGAMALMLALMVRIVALAAILQAGAYGAALALIAAHALSRAALVWHWSDLAPAKTDGVAASSGQPDEDAGVYALVSGLGIALIGGLLARGVLTTIIAFAFAATATFGFRQLCNKKIDGHTGDTLGAAAILAELAFLTGLASSL